MSDMLKWAEEEIELASNKQDDYGRLCYKSALKAYTSLLEDNHSGMSWGFTQNILIRLMKNLPLSPITEEDFNLAENQYEEDTEWLKNCGLKRTIQCPRMVSLFREETLDGKVTYHDTRRIIGVDSNGHTYRGGGCAKYVDELFPITLPYYPPTNNEYYVYTEDFLLDKKNGDYDHLAYLYIKTPEGKEVLLNKYFKEDNGQFVEITKEDYLKDKENKIS